MCEGSRLSSEPQFSYMEIPRTQERARDTGILTFNLPNLFIINEIKK
jgi:hypothetical protein